jgi:hypothetical protein
MRKIVATITTTSLMSLLLASIVVLGFAPLPPADAQPGCNGNAQNGANSNGRGAGAERNIRTVEQLNHAIARQSGGDTAQNQQNAATLEGDHFNIHQRNLACSEGADSSFQNQANLANVQGDHNNIHQTNRATTDADNSVQIASNTANVEGDHNNVHQRNQQQASGSGSVSQQASNTANFGSSSDEDDDDDEPEGDTDE